MKTNDSKDAHLALAAWRRLGKLGMLSPEEKDSIRLKFLAKYPTHLPSASILRE